MKAEGVWGSYLIVGEHSVIVQARWPYKTRWEFPYSRIQGIELSRAGWLSMGRLKLIVPGQSSLGLQPQVEFRRKTQGQFEQAARMIGARLHGQPT